MAEMVDAAINAGLIRRLKIEVLWWAYNCLDESTDRTTYLGGRADCAERLAELGEVP